MNCNYLFCGKYRQGTASHLAEEISLIRGSELQLCRRARPSPHCHPEPARASCERCEGSALRFALQLQPCRNAAGRPLRLSLLSSRTDSNIRNYLFCGNHRRCSGAEENVYPVLISSRGL